MDRVEDSVMVDMEELLGMLPTRLDVDPLLITISAHAH